MAIEDDVAALQQQVNSLSSQISSLSSSLSGLNTKVDSHDSSISSLDSTLSGLNTQVTSHDSSISSLNATVVSKANSNSPMFTGTPKAPTPGNTSNDTSIATTAYINSKLDTLASASTVPYPLGAIADMSIDEEGNITQPSSSGTAGTSQSFSRDDHVHQGDTTRAPIDSPVFLGTPMSSYVPDVDSDDANSFVLATTMFVRKLCLSLLDGSKSDSTVIIPPNSGEATAPSQPGGNSENLSIGGGGLRGTGGSPGGKGGKGDFTSWGGNNATGGKDGIDGTDGEKGSIVIYGIPSGASLNWDIATYVHTPG